MFSELEWLHTSNWCHHVKSKTKFSERNKNCVANNETLLKEDDASGARDI